MKLSKNQRAHFWRELSKLKKDVSDLKGLFQNPGEISQEGYVEWNVRLAGVFKGLQKMQLDFGVVFSGGEIEGLREE